eukprot:Gb_14256 [translate_table: standard]
MERYKLAAARRAQKRIIIGQKFNTVAEEFQKFEWQIRSCYHKQLDCNEETLAWMMALDASFVLEYCSFIKLQNYNLTGLMKSQSNRLTVHRKRQTMSWIFEKRTNNKWLSSQGEKTPLIFSSIDIKYPTSVISHVYMMDYHLLVGMKWRLRNEENHEGSKENEAESNPLLLSMLNRLPVLCMFKCPLTFLFQTTSNGDGKYVAKISEASSSRRKSIEVPPL